MVQAARLVVWSGSSGGELPSLLGLVSSQRGSFISEPLATLLHKKPREAKHPSTTRLWQCSHGCFQNAAKSQPSLTDQVRKVEESTTTYRNAKATPEHRFPPATLTRLRSTKRSCKPRSLPSRQPWSWAFQCPLQEDSQPCVSTVIYAFFSLQCCMAA